MTGNANVTGTLTAGTFSGPISGTATTATNLAGGVANQVPYQTAANNTTFVGAPGANSVLFANAENHLRSIRGVKKEKAAGLQKRLALATAKLKDIPQGQVSTIDQARFALGFYHAKADNIERWAAREREKAEKAEREKAEKAAAKNQA